MRPFFDLFTPSTGFMPHGHCFLWTPGLLWLKVLSDLTTGLAYCVIPVGMAWYLHKRPELPFRQVYLLFSAFILLCGVSHFLEIWTIWIPSYWGQGMVKLATALVSVFAAMRLLPMLPRLLLMPSLEETNARLQQEIDQRIVAEEELDRFFQLSPDLFCVIGADGRFLRANPAMAALLGYTLEELLAIPYRETVHDDSWPAVQAEIQQVLTGGISRDFTIGLRHRSGAEMWTEWTVASDGLAIYAAGRDISEKKRVTKSLRTNELLRQNAEMMYGLLFANMADGVVVIDERGRITMFNTAAAGIFGWSAADIIGHNVSLLMGEPHHGQHDGYLATYLAGGEKNIIDQAREVGAIKKDGRPIMIELRVREFFLSNTRHFIAVVRDVGQERQARELTERLNSEQLEAAHQAALIIIASDILHNVGNLLVTVTVGLIQLREGLQTSKLGRLGQAMAIFPDSSAKMARFLAEDPRGEQIMPYLRELSAYLAAERVAWQADIAEVLKAGMAISQIIANQQSLVSRGSSIIESVNLAGFLEEILAMLAESFTRHAITIVRHFGKVPCILSERKYLLQAFTNLFWNARDALKEQHDRERELVVEMFTDGAMVTIIVADNGCGIPQENLGLVFTHGFTTKPQGNGFGLHSVKHAIEYLGGNVSVASAGIGHWTSFTIKLPIKEE